MTSEITFVASYTCPRCQAELDSPAGTEGMWLVCPKCGRASLPPNVTPIARQPRPVVDADVVYIGPGGDETSWPVPSPLRPSRQALNPWRVFLLLGLAFCLFGLAESFLSQNSLRSAIFGFALLIFVGLVTYPTKRNRP